MYVTQYTTTNNMMHQGGLSIYVTCTSKEIQSNLINMDTEGTIESVCINRVSVLRATLLEQNTKEIKEDIGIFKLTSSLTFTKSSFHGLNPLKKIAYLYSSRHNQFDARKQSEIDIYKSLYLVYCSAENINMLSTEDFLTFKKERFHVITYI